jgi:transposase-like protein
LTAARAFRGFRSPSGIILWAVRWYLQFAIRYHDLERRMLANRGAAVLPKALDQSYTVNLRRITVDKNAACPRGQGDEAGWRAVALFEAAQAKT